MIRIHTEQTIASLRALEDELDIVARQTLGQGATFALAHARATTKFNDRTRRLRGSMKRINRGTYEVHVEARTDYSSFVEEGTSRMEPRWYMRDARDAAEIYVTRFIELGVNRATG